ICFTSLWPIAGPVSENKKSVLHQLLQHLIAGNYSLPDHVKIIYLFQIYTRSTVERLIKYTGVISTR
ncbi:hypothetical protein ACYCMW_26260, partial [Klebsiella pneumoniae]